ncbi:hypothetical protein C8J56DRAFT_171150 [Mycena floridula]|nr:hypothetical protein C8J56DRAFT_171150 [Mycena floridula]
MLFVAAKRAFPRRQLMPGSDEWNHLAKAVKQQRAIRISNLRQGVQEQDIHSRFGKQGIERIILSASDNSEEATAFVLFERPIGVPRHLRRDGTSLTIRFRDRPSTVKRVSEAMLTPMLPVEEIELMHRPDTLRLQNLLSNTKSSDIVREFASYGTILRIRQTPNPNGSGRSNFIIHFAPGSSADRCINISVSFSGIQCRVMPDTAAVSTLAPMSVHYTFPRKRIGFAPTPAMWKSSLLDIQSTLDEMGIGKHVKHLSLTRFFEQDDKVYFYPVLRGDLRFVSLQEELRKELEVLGMKTSSGAWLQLQTKTKRRMDPRSTVQAAQVVFEPIAAASKPLKARETSDAIAPIKLSPAAQSILALALRARRRPGGV